MTFFKVDKTTTQRKIESFRTLNAGWHYGAGGPVSVDVISRAQDVYLRLLMHSLTRTDAFAGAGGEVLVAAYRGNHYVGVTIEPDGSYAMTHEIEGREEDDVRDDGLTLGDLKKRLGGIAETWNMSGSSTRITSTPYAESSTILRSSDHQMVGCQFSSSPAPRQLAAA